MVKNAVIVPTGAKGGFVAKRLPDPHVDRDAWLAEGVACYRTFISCLLDLTDNYVTGRGRRRSRSCRRRRPAATTPTTRTSSSPPTRAPPPSATSPTASPIDYGFWLGDAFASRRLGRLRPQGHGHHRPRRVGVGEVPLPRARRRTPRAEDFTVVGIGDMSGDVFGNGMLLSEHIRLVAAFDHRHIFLDPDPDAATSFAERRRLFDLPRSSLGRLRHVAASPRAAASTRARSKAIPISPQVARGARPRRSASRKLTPDRADPRDPARAGRPALERRHRHLRQGVDRDARRRRRQGQRRAARRRRTSCAARSSARAATSASPSAAASSSPAPAGTSTPTRSTTRPASTPPTTR